MSVSAPCPCAQRVCVFSYLASDESASGSSEQARVSVLYYPLVCVVWSLCASAGDRLWLAHSSSSALESESRLSVSHVSEHVSLQQ